MCTNIPSKLFEDGIDLVDLAILHNLLEGRTYKEIGVDLGLSDRSVIQRIDALESRGFIKKGKRQIPLIDIFRLWNHVFITHVKLHLPSAVPLTIRKGVLTPVTPTPPPPSWMEILDEMKKEQIFRKIVRQAYILFGSEYDVMLVITTQSMDEYVKLFETFQKKGFIERVWGTKVIETANYHFDPIAVPNPEEVEISLDLMKKQKLWKNYHSGSKPMKPSVKKQRRPEE